MRFYNEMMRRLGFLPQYSIAKMDRWGVQGVYPGARTHALWVEWRVSRKPAWENSKLGKVSAPAGASSYTMVDFCDLIDRTNIAINGYEQYAADEFNHVAPQLYRLLCNQNYWPDDYKDLDTRVQIARTRSFLMTNADDYLAVLPVLNYFEQTYFENENFDNGFPVIK